MARFYPTNPQNFHGSDGESIVYKALQKLDNSYIVLHSYHWLGEECRHRSEGEVDFLVLHPGQGILAIEVKAGGISYHDGTWLQINRHDQTQKEINPLGQAAESQYRILSLLRRKFYQTDCPMVCRAAWFPSVILNKNIPLPLEADRVILLDEDSLANPKQALDQAFAFWQKNLNQASSMTASQCEQVVELLLPSLNITQTLNCCAEEDEQQYIQLTRQQAAIIQYLCEQPTAAIHGPAGTGKTLLALERAKLLAANGQKVLYLCFNEFLLSNVRQKYAHSLITYHNVRSLAEEILGDATPSIEEIIPCFEKYLDAKYDDEKWPYPNIIVDEGQDLSDTLLEHLAYLAELHNGTFYIFYDRNQYIFNNRIPSWIDAHAECKLVLYKNCRNTAEIASSIVSIAHLKSATYLNNIHGIPPKASFYRFPEELKSMAERFIKMMLQQRLKLEDIVILSVHSIPHSALNGLTTLAGFPVSEKQEPGKIWLTSVRKYKGLEAKAVLLIDIDISKITDSLTQRLIYVGCSRANTYLKVAFHEDISVSAYGELLQKFTDEKVPNSRKGLVKLLGMEGE
jgi:hypothetical protein